MKEFPSFENKQEGPNRLAEIAKTQGEELDALVAKKGYGKLLEGLRKKLNIAVLCGSISLTALVAAGCGGKKAEQIGAQEESSRFPRVEDVVKGEKERDVLLNKALDDISYHRFNFEQDGSLVIELHGTKWHVKERDVAFFKTMAHRKLAEMSAPNASAMRKDISYNALKERLDSLIPADGELLNTNEVKMTETQGGKTEGGIRTETRTRTIEPIREKGTGLKQNQIRTSPNFGSQPKTRGSKEVDIDDF